TPTRIDVIGSQPEVGPERQAALIADDPHRVESIGCPGLLGVPEQEDGHLVAAAANPADVEQKPAIADAGVETDLPDLAAGRARARAAGGESQRENDQPEDEES